MKDKGRPDIASITVNGVNAPSFSPKDVPLFKGRKVSGFTAIKLVENQTVNKAGNGFWYQPNILVPIRQAVTIVFDNELDKSIEYVPYSEGGSIHRSLLFMGMEFTSLRIIDVSGEPGRLTIFTIDNPDFSIRCF